MHIFFVLGDASIGSLVCKCFAPIEDPFVIVERSIKSSNNSKRGSNSCEAAVVRRFRRLETKASGRIDSDILFGGVCE